MSEQISRKLEQGALIVFAAALAIGSFLVVKPFLSAILWAIILALATWPVFGWLTAKLSGKKQLAALLLICLYFLLMVVPIGLLGWSLADNVKDAYTATMELVEQRELPQPPSWITDLPYGGEWITQKWQEISVDNSSFFSLLKRVAPYAYNILMGIASYSGQALFYVVLSIFIVFFIYRDGEKFFGTLQLAVAKVAGEKSKRLLTVAGATLRSVVYGIIGTALAQGVLAGIGAAILAVPNPVLLGLLTFILSPIPMGPVLIWGGAAIWLFMSATTWMGVAMLLWGALVVSSVDNFLKPYLISRGSKMPLALVLLGVMGGAMAFGVLGIFLGPALLAVSATVFNEWNAEVNSSKIIQVSEVTNQEGEED